MDKTEEKSVVKENGLPHDEDGICKKIAPAILEWAENLTILDISNQNLSHFDENIKLPPNLTELNISHNNLNFVPKAVASLRKLSVLNLSQNKIVYFDDTPEFYNTIEHLNLSQNSLLGPPYWVWAEAPKKLQYLNLSNNNQISESFKDGNFETLLQYTTLVKQIIIYNCKLTKYPAIFGCFPQATTLDIGAKEINYLAANMIPAIPFPGLDKCCDIETLNLRNTKLYTVNSNIDIYKNLKKIDLSVNNISYLPEEFGNIEMLEICILTSNYLLYLPESFKHLKALKQLFVDDNELCMLSEDLCSLPKLECIDLYNNKLYEIPDGLWNVSEIDFAQNYLEEPDNEEYSAKKVKYRLKVTTYNRADGAKPDIEEEQPPDKLSSDEEFSEVINSDDGETARRKLAPSSSESDWDSDQYWVPQATTPRCCPAPHSPWLYYIKQKMDEGNFCPMDLHTVPVMDRVHYERQCNPQVVYDSDGQFDVSEDEGS